MKSARLVEERAVLGGVLVEFGEFLAVLAARQKMDAALCGPRLEAAETVFDIREPIAALGIFALIDDIDADRPLFGNDGANRLAQLRFVIRRRFVELHQIGQAADMRR